MRMIENVFETELGRAVSGDSLELMAELESQSVDLIVTSPPFGLVRKKSYGNKDSDEYVNWFRPFAQEMSRILKPNGSLVIDLGGAWTKGVPTKSLYQYKLLICLCDEFGFNLCQDFFWWNPSKLPTPAEWVTIRRIRVKDAVNCIWWLSPTPWPKASNRRVLSAYSKSMEVLLKHGYQPRLRPSGHDISTKFQKDNGGAIPPNVLAIANTRSTDPYVRFCEANALKIHDARFPAELPAFFVKFLSDPGDFVFDPFAGSCMTGAVSEQLGRKWMCCDLIREFVSGGRGYFQGDFQLGTDSSVLYEIRKPDPRPSRDPEMQLDSGREFRRSRNDDRGDVM